MTRATIKPEFMQPISIEPSALIFGLIGFLTGVLVNLLADYLPARRHHELARKSPFASPSSIPPRPVFGPRREDGTRWPLYLWSGVTAALMRAPVFKPPRLVRRIAVELLLAFAFGAISALYPGTRFLPFYLFYAAVFALVIVTDVEYRWILPETVWIPALVALFEAAFVPRMTFGESLRGGLLGFGILFGLYLLGIAFGSLMRVLTGRAVGRTVLGFGDVRMAALSGIILGEQAIGPALVLMMLGGGVAAMIFIVDKRLRKRPYRRYSAIPYGPYVVFGTAFMLYLPPLAIGVIRWLMSLVRV